MREHLIDMLVMTDTIRIELIFETLGCLSTTDTKDHWHTLRFKSDDPWKVVAPRVVEFPRKDFELIWLVRRECLEILWCFRSLEPTIYKRRWKSVKAGRVGANTSHRIFFLHSL